MNPRESVVGGAIVVAAVVAVGAFKAAAFDHATSHTTVRDPSLGRDPIAPAPVPSSPPARPTPRVAALTGLPLESDNFAAVSARRPVAIMVDNGESAVPQAGLDRADVVIEALVEGGITRLMAVYQSREANLVEPVRSARTPFLHWALEYDAIYAHVGRAEIPGEADAGQQILDWKVADLDMEGGPQPAPAAFSRDPRRAAPHNAVASTEALRRLAEARGFDRTPQLGGWRFSSNPESAVGAPARAITVGFGREFEFSSQWAWDEASETYLRSQFGAPHVDAATGHRLSATNVIVQFARSYVADTLRHVLVENIGQGRALVFTRGKTIEATWRKPDDASRTRFFGPDGVEILFAPGITWIEVVDVSATVMID